MGDFINNEKMSYGFQPPPYKPNAPPQPECAPPPPYQPPAGQVAYIRHASSDLCLDATEYVVKLQRYNPSSMAQQWSLEPLGGNRYTIRCRANGAVLDIQGGADCGSNLITYESHGGENQQWCINSDCTITSAADGDLAIDVCEGDISPGNMLIAYDKHGGPNQQFNVQYM